MKRYSAHLLSMVMVCSGILNSCSHAADRTDPSILQILKSYDLSSPDASYDLPDDLQEISGISWYGSDQIACIQDEIARIYLFDTKAQHISFSYGFGKHDDYEDLAVNKDTAWVLTSSGTLYRIKDFKDKEPEVKKYSTRLSAKNDTEGLALNLHDNYLLIACKNMASINDEESMEGLKAVYRFGTLDNKLKENPEILIDPDQISTQTESNFFKRTSLKLARILHLTEYENFQPSGLAIHPFTEELYMISAYPGILLVLDRHASIKHIQPLNTRLFGQAEGICFSPSGDLYISNEGGPGKATILKFEYRSP